MAERLKIPVSLVLSSGGSKGLAHIGVINELELIFLMIHQVLFTFIKRKN